jgi:hypothetical protein
MSDLRPGEGGLIPPPVNAPAGQATPIGVQPGTPSQIARLTQIIITPGAVLQGIFTYSTNPGAAGTLIESAGVATAGTDQYGNHFVTGHASYGATFAASLNAGVIQFYTGSLAGGWTAAGEVEIDSSGDLFLLAASGRSVVTNNNTLDDGAGNMTVAGTGTFQGSGITVGNGAAANITLTPKMATPPNLAAVIAQTATLAQTQACLGGIVQSMQNRQLVN